MEAEPIKDKLNCDIVVIGAGPAGAFFSYLMAKKGFSVIVLESRSQTKRKVCGDYICPPGKIILLNNDLGHIVNKSRPIESMRIVTQNHIVDCPFPIDKTGISISRLILDTELIHAAQNAEANFLFSESAQDIKINSENAVVTTKSRQIHCKLIVGADGRTSWIAKKLNLTRNSNSSRVALRTFVKSNVYTPHRAELHLLKNTYVGVNHIENNLISVALVLDKDLLQTHLKNGSLHECMLQSLLNAPHLVSQFSDDWISTFNLTPIDTSAPLSHSVSSTISQRVALIGDAAGYVDPITGEGNFMALNTATALSSLFTEQKDLDSQIESKLVKYKDWHKTEVKTKLILNSGFQKLIKHPRLISWMGSHLNFKESRRQAFINLVANVEPPAKTIASIIF